MTSMVIESGLNIKKLCTYIATLQVYMFQSTTIHCMSVIAITTFHCMYVAPSGKNSYANCKELYKSKSCSYAESK